MTVICWFFLLAFTISHHHVVSSSSDVEQECTLYLMPSIIPGAGRGIVSGRRLAATRPIETVSSILIRDRTSQSTQLKNYVFGTDEYNYHMIKLGAGSLYNHQQHPVVNHYWADPDVKRSSTILDHPYSNFTKSVFDAYRDIDAGEEMSIYYGDNWFNRFDDHHSIKEANITAAAATDHIGQDSSSPPRVVEVQDMRRFGHCLSHVHVAASTVEHAGNGLFAGKSFMKGDVVVVSPVLTLSKSIIDSEEGVLRNYCFASRESKMVLFPLNNGAMINHNSAGPANVRIDWYSWLEAYRAIASKYHSSEGKWSGMFDLTQLMALSVEELFGYSFAALDLSFIATRDIAADEEIFVDYGSEWVHAWSRYQQELSVFRSSSASQRSCSDGDAGSSPSDQCQALGDAPVFKQYIAVPEGLYPQHWHRGQECTLYLMPSIIPGAGRGIVSGRRLSATMPIEAVPTLLIEDRTSQATQLRNYVFFSGEKHFDMINWGAGSLYNHQQQGPSVHHYWDDELVKNSSTIRDLPYSNFTKTLFLMIEPVAVGTELSIYYGDNWFQRFNTSHLHADSETTAAAATDHKGYDSSSPPRVVEVQDMRRFGHCLSHVHVAASTVEHAGNGLFAGKSFMKGDVVVVSPVLTLPKSIIDSEEGVLRNYCFASRESKMVLFPLNNGAMINHNSAGPANVRIDWYSWLEAYRAIASKYHSRQEEGTDSKSGVFDLTQLMALSVEELFGYSFAALDLSFIATRDIAADEEIFVDYGSEWVHAWSRYQAELSVFRSSSTSQRSCSDGDAGSSPSDQCQALGDAPMFKQYIAVPEGLYPQHW